MNQTHSYVDVAQGHMPHSSVNSATSAPPHYSGYSQHTPIHGGLPAYGSSPVTYPGYGGYGNGMASIPSGGSSAGPMGSHLAQQSSIPLPSLATPSQASAGPPGMQRPMDQTGQHPPPGMKPRVTATLWEDEGSLCFQVEAAGVCVARREDNHMINGTKLLNVAGMTRGRRDGILKSEKTRHVVKIGPMHLKGVWIPFERALDFANKEKITEQLYPLFVHNIGALLYQSPNGSRHSTSAAGLASSERRREEQSDYMRTPQSTQPPSLQHHHSMTNSGGANSQPAQHAIAPNPAAGRPGLDRAHTFPTPPTSASSVIGMGHAGSSYEWGGPQIPTTQPLSIDTNLSNARSVPATPASTPPANSMQHMSGYQTSGPYDNGRPIYGHASQSSYSSQYPMSRYGAVQPSPGGVKNEMGPPPRTAHDMDDKRDIYTSHSQEHPPSSDAGEGDHDGDYTHSAGPYGQNRSSYGYNPHPTPTTMNHDQSHVSPEMTGSPQKVSGRATPRTATGYAGYSTPQRAQQLPSSNLYNVMNDNRNGSASDMYSGGYASQQYPAQNGIPQSNKRSFTMDDDEQTNGIKRQKSSHDRKPPAMMAQQQKR